MMLFATAVEFRCCVTAETLKACALIGLHMTAEEATFSSFSGLSPVVLTGMWRNSGPRNFFSDGGVGGWIESECIPYFDVYEHNFEGRALEVTGQDLSSEVVSLSFLRIGSFGLSCGVGPESFMSQCLEDSVTLEGL